jgi:uncharacterized protein (DUF3820 family)
MGVFNDLSIMPWGKYKGQTMINVPPSYLLWLLENDKCHGLVKKYIVDNEDVLKAQIKQGQ